MIKKHRDAFVYTTVALLLSLGLIIWFVYNEWEKGVNDVSFASVAVMVVAFSFILSQWFRTFRAYQSAVRREEVVDEADDSHL